MQFSQTTELPCTDSYQQNLFDILNRNFQFVCIILLVGTLIFGIIETQTFNINVLIIDFIKCYELVILAIQGAR